MDAERKNMLFRIIGIAGLAVLLVLVVWAERQAGQEPRSSVALEHDHSDPEQHDPGETSLPLSNEEASRLLPSGVRKGDVRVINYEAFHYGFTPDPVVVKAGERLRLNVKSRDVPHGIAIPDINFSATIPAESTKAVELTAPAKPGKYSVFCNVYCGPKHGEMRGTMIVLPAEAGGHHD